MDDFAFRLDSLTLRERQIMSLVAEGYSNKSIGAELAISPRTVEMHRSHAMRKVGAKNVAALVRMSMVAAENGVNGDCESSGDPSSRLGLLTSRERQVMALVTDGHSNKSIANKLSISSRTVEVHRAQVMLKVGAGSLAGLVRISMSAAEKSAFGVGVFGKVRWKFPSAQITKEIAP